LQRIHDADCRAAKSRAGWSDTGSSSDGNEPGPFRRTIKGRDSPTVFGDGMPITLKFADAVPSRTFRRCLSVTTSEVNRSPFCLTSSVATRGCRRQARRIRMSIVRRQAFFPVVLPHSAMLPNKVCCDLSLFHSSSGDEVRRRGRHLSPLLQQLCRSCETVLASPRCFVRPLARETEAGSAETQPGKE
jgi:hypothetical protein